mmetsp:Transcript_22983/g.71648  ORF Transcript_22983/g.71648 Transcript_22983/m.71648 type:complete len:247 (+) Transcript_22983:580-1320(+)
MPEQVHEARRLLLLKTGHALLLGAVPVVVVQERHERLVKRAELGCVDMLEQRLPGTICHRTAIVMGQLCSSLHVQLNVGAENQPAGLLYLPEPLHDAYQGLCLVPWLHVDLVRWRVVLLRRLAALLRNAQKLGHGGHASGELRGARGGVRPSVLQTAAGVQRVPDGAPDVARGTGAEALDGVHDAGDDGPDFIFFGCLAGVLHRLELRLYPLDIGNELGLAFARHAAACKGPRAGGQWASGASATS